jgi:type VI protein secretion system component Hcp
MKRNLSQPTSVPQQKGSNQKPQISGHASLDFHGAVCVEIQASELPESELNKVAGGADRVDHGGLKIVKVIDKASSKPY